jgi:TonB family protein
MMSASIQQASVLSGRHMMLMAVIGLHALVITALIASKFVPPMIEKELRMTWIDEQQPEELPPPPQPARKPLVAQRFQVVVPVIAPPEINLPLEAEVAEAPAAESGPVQVQSDPGPVTDTVVEAPARVFTDLRYSIERSTEEYYPPASVSLQEQGVAIVRICVDGAGRLSGRPSIQTTSGFKRLDQAALKWAGEALKFTPAMGNGVGVPACKGFRVVFNLN